MKRLMFRLSWVCVVILALTSFSDHVLAQVPFNYRLEYKQMPSGTTGFSLYDVVEVNGGMIAVGSYNVGGVTRGFIYDQQNNLFTDITDIFDLVGFASSCRGINSTGIVIGNVVDQAGAGTRRVYWFDYFANPPTLNFLDQQFPIIGTMARQNAVDINVHGDIVVDELGNRVAFVANPIASSIVEFDMLEPIAISDTGFVVGSEGSNADNIYSVARWHPMIPKEVFSGPRMQASTGEVNIYGQFGVVLDDGPAAAGTPCRIGTQIDWTGNTNNAYFVGAVNESGDLAYMATVTSGKGANSTTLEKGFFYHASQNQVFRIDNLVSDVFLNTNPQTGIYLTNRVSLLDLPTPVITGQVYNTTTNDWRIYFLIPEEAPPTFTYTSSDTPKTIPDLGMTVSSITVADDFSIADLNVTLNINHGRAQDLDVYLIAPNGTRVHLFTDVGGNGVNFVGTTLDDEATTAITSGATPFTGSYRPEGSLGAVNGLSTLGLWKLEVTDDKALKTGTILNWSFTVETP